MHMKLGGVGLVAVLGMQSLAMAQNGGKTTLHRRDRRFMTAAAQGGMAEVALGQMASEKGTSSAVKQFGTQMVQDHGKANTELTELAGQLGVTLPKDMGRTHQAEANRLSKLSGAQFDRAYMDAMVKDHVEDVSEFKSESKHGAGAVKEWAGKTLPTLEEHLKMARDIDSHIDKGKPGKSHGPRTPIDYRGPR